MTPSAATPETEARDLVVGGGVAGLAAAIALAQAGRPVTLIEKRPTLGGRALSFEDAKTGDEVDNGQHILLGCCTNAIDFLKSIGRGASVDWTSTFHYRLPEGERHDFALRRWPAPLHAFPALAGFGALSLRSRLAVMRAFATLPFRSAEQRRAEADQTMADWLARRRQPREAIERFWNPILVGAVNEELDRAAVAPCLKVFLDGFVPHPDAARFGVPNDGLGKIIGEGARQKLEALGVRVERKAQAARIVHEDRRAQALELADGRRLAAAAILVATPWPALRRLQEASGVELVLPQVGPTIAWSPIAGIHLWYDRVVSELDHGCLLDSPAHWYFTRPSNWREGGQRISFVVSASRHLEDLSAAECAELADRELKRYLPEARGAERLHEVVVRERRATFSATPDFEAERPAHATPLKNVLIAGDWVGTDWPSTLEGAIRSGRQAADRIIDDGRSRVVPDLPTSWLAAQLRR